MGQFGIVPQMFEVVILPYIGQEDVDQYIGIVHGYPLGIFQSYDMSGLFLESFTGEIAHRLGNRFYLSGRIALTDDEIFADGAFNLCQVGYDDIGAFFFPEFPQ